MGTGSLTPPPALNTPPPVEPPLPGPRPPPFPEPMPVPEPVPMPPPVPGPLEGGPGTAVGLPHVLSAIWGSFTSGGPSRVGSTGSFGLGILILTVGGASCCQENFGTAPFEAGVVERSPPPPPPPAFFGAGGKCRA